jgi:drug/metabolite transporter (DMT)-like permease
VPRQTDIRKILLIGWAFLGEPLSPARAAGALLVGGEIYVVNSAAA